MLDHRDAGAGVLADVKGLVLWECDWCRVLQGIPRHFLAVDIEDAGAALAEALAFGLEVEGDGVLARAQLGAFPDRALEIEQIVEKHHFAAADAELALAQEQAVAAEAPAFGDDHPLGAQQALGNVDLCGDGIGLVQDARCGAVRHAAQLARVREDRPPRREVGPWGVPACKRRVVER